MPDVVKRYSLFQRSLRLVQTSIRRLNRWASTHVPGLPNPPELEESLRKPHFVDLWELTLGDHRRIFHEVWHEYKASFASPSDEDLDRSKKEVKRALQSIRGQVSSNVNKNLSFLDKSLEGTKAHENLHTLGTQGAKNVQFIAKEMQHVAEGIDLDAVSSHAKQVVSDYRSKDDMAITLQKNVNELRNLAKEGRDAALRLEKKDIDTFKLSMQSWLADKLLVGQSVLMAFIDGYREGKALEMERKDALLITFAKQAAEDHKDIIEKQVTKIMDHQRKQQRQEQEEAAMEAAHNTGRSEVKEESTETKPDTGKSSDAVQPR